MGAQFAASAFRHEFKYYSPEYILKELESRARAIMRLDPNAGESGAYHIRSMYFDDLHDTCYTENENGTDPREKFRIRIYNNSSSRIMLELKQKIRGMTRKMSCPISLERCEQLMAGKRPGFSNEDPFVYKKFCSQMLMRGLRPVALVCYDRVPYIWKEGNVRVTFDRNIRSGRDFSRFFDAALPARPVLPSGFNLLEVKFDELLPDFLFELLQVSHLQQTTFSKYYLCRRYGLRGIA